MTKIYTIQKIKTCQNVTQFVKAQRSAIIIPYRLQAV